jgi:hypothetical protein
LRGLSDWPLRDGRHGTTPAGGEAESGWLFERGIVVTYAQCLQIGLAVRRPFFMGDRLQPTAVTCRLPRSPSLFDLLIPRQIAWLLAETHHVKPGV